MTKMSLSPELSTHYVDQIVSVTICKMCFGIPSELFKNFDAICSSGEILIEEVNEYKKLF